MNKKEIIEFINKNPIAYMGTIDENGQPRVRAMGTFRAQEDGIIFSMQTPKPIYKQLVANPVTEVCYFAEGTQVRIAGKLEESKDPALREEILKARPFLQPGVDEIGMDYIGIFILKGGKADILVMSDQPKPGSPKNYIDM